MESKKENANLVEKVQQAAVEKEETEETIAKTAEETPMEKLKKIKQLFEMELITEADYNEKKKAILEKM